MNLLVSPVHVIACDLFHVCGSPTCSKIPFLLSSQTKSGIHLIRTVSRLSTHLRIIACDSQGRFKDPAR